MRTIKAFVAAALCAVGISAFAEPDAVQLWEGGPYFATCNIGAEKPADFGILTNFNDAAQAVTNALGEGWRLPTDQEFEDLLSYCEKKSETCKDGTGADRAGWRFTGKGDYSLNSIFLPAAGFDGGSGRVLDGGDGEYWSSVARDSTCAYELYWYECDPKVLPSCDRSNGLSLRAVKDPPPVVAQFVKGGEVVAKFETAEEAVAALDDAQYADIEEFRIGLAADTVFDFGGRTNRVVILNVGDVENTLKNVLLDCAGDYVVTGMVGTVVFGDGVRIEKSALDFKQGWVDLIIKGGLYKNDPIGYCEDGYLSARRYDENENLNGLYAVLPAAEIAVEDRKNLASTRYATLQDAFNLIGENKEVTLRLFNNLELGTAVTKLEGNKVIHLLPSEFGANTITRVGAEPVIEIGRGAKLEIKNVVFDGANVTSEKPMIEVAGKTGTNFGWLIAGDGFVVSNAVGGAVHVGNGGKFELDGVAKIFENTTDGNPKNVIIEDSKAIQLTACGAVTDGNYAQIGVWSGNPKFMIPGGQFGTVDTSYEYATDFADGDISVAKPWVGFINDLDGSLHHAAGAKIAAAPTTAKKTYKRWVGGEYKELVEEGDYLISRVSAFPTAPGYLPELIWTARQEAPAAELAPAVLDWTDTTFTLKVLNGCDYALVTSGSTETNWVSMVGTNTYVFARPEGGDCICLSRRSITPSNVVSAATAYPVRVPTGAKDNPWFIGATAADNMVAYTNWAGNIFVEGAGVMKDFDASAPWASDAVTEAVIGEDVTTIGAHAFAECPNLKMLALYGQTPPSLGAGNDFTGVTVVVPGGAGPVYAAADGWKNFNLVEMCGSTREVTGHLYAVDYEWYDFVLAERLAELVAVDDPLKDRPAGYTNDHRRGIRCLAVRKDGLVGRNLDAALSDADEYVVRTSAAFGRPHATLAVANEGFFRQAAARPFTEAERIALRPVFVDDGINDAGLVVSANSIFSRSAGVTEDTNPDGNWLVQPLVTRYLLDYAGSAAEALEILTNCSTRALWKNKESECHWLIADPNETYVVECVSNRIVALKVPQGKAAAMTNYLLARSPHSSDFEALVGGNLISAEHTPYARGIERYEAAMSALASVDGTEAMLALLKDQRYSQVYAADRERDFWSEANGEMVDLATPGGGIGNYHTFTVSDGSEFDEARMSFFANERAKDEARRKKTIHSAVYDIAAQKVRIAVQEDYAKAYDFWIVEPDPGCEKNPWKVGDNGEEPPRYAEAYTNGTELVIGGAGAVEDLSEIPSAVKDDIKAITIADATVTGAAEDAFAGLDNVDLTLPDNWQGELPKNNSWYGATGVELTRWPMAVKNVKPQQRYPWNGLVDINFNLTGEGMVNVAALVTTNGVALANPTVTSETVFDLGGGKELKNLKLVWDAKADFGDEGLHEKIKVKLTVSPAEPE